MKAIARLRRAALVFVLAAFAAGPFIPVLAQSLPAAKAPALKSARVESLKLSPDAAATPVVLAAPDAAAIDNVKRANAGATLKRLQIGLARAAPATRNADSAALDWQAVEGGHAARWSVTSAQAQALRVGLQVKRSDPTLEMRFSSPSRPGVVYGPFREGDFNAAAGNTYWSPVLEGDTAIVELFVQGEAAPHGLSVKIAEVSHLLANPADPKAELQLKSAEFCEVNFICLAAADAALHSTGEAVARMTFVDSTGGTFLCTGTLLNSAGNQFVPYFYTANHCIDSQAAASTLTTYWFYESLSCGSNTVNPDYVQVGGGAVLLYADTSTDVAFVRLNRAPPSNATFAGWDAATLANGLPLTAIHHPDGDVKKVSLATMGGFVADINETGRTGSFIKSNWNSIATGVTEGGSSGSGIFTRANGSYSFRGGLLGGPSSCTASSSDLYDYYSRFDVAYPKLAQYLGAGVPASNYTALWYNSPAESESGWGINITHEGDIVFATLFTYGPGGTPLWLVMSRGERQGTGDTFSGPLYQTTAKGNPNVSPWPGVTTSQVGTMTLAFTSADTASLSYSVNGTSVSKTITKEVFSPTGAAACGNTTGSRAFATNYTDLWYNAPAESEPGWGINVTHQGSIVFATLFTYRSDGQEMWYVMSRGERQSDGSFTGPLYQMNGNGPFNAQPWPGASPSQVGNMTLRFADGENGTLAYSVNGVSTTKQIVRQVFSTPTPLCTG